MLRLTPRPSYSALFDTRFLPAYVSILSFLDITLWKTVNYARSISAVRRLRLGGTRGNDISDGNAKGSADTQAEDLSGTGIITFRVMRLVACAALLVLHVATPTISQHRDADTYIQIAMSSVYVRIRFSLAYVRFTTLWHRRMLSYYLYYLFGTAPDPAESPQATSSWCCSRLGPYSHTAISGHSLRIPCNQWTLHRAEFSGSRLES